MLMKHLLTLVALTLWAGLPAVAQSVPPELSRLAARAGLESPMAGWCRGEFRAGHSGAYAVAITGAGGGRYVVLDADASVMELAPFARTPELACYTPAEARKLNADIRQSETIHGQVRPRWATTVVCAFVDEVTSVCWQYSPARHAFVDIGGWVT
jgi:hypothetical protein